MSRCYTHAHTHSKAHISTQTIAGYQNRQQIHQSSSNQAIRLSVQYKACLSTRSCRVTERADNTLKPWVFLLPWGRHGNRWLCLYPEGHSDPLSDLEVEALWLKKAIMFLAAGGQLVWVRPRCPWVILGERDWKRPCNCVARGPHSHLKAKQQMTFLKRKLLQEFPRKSPWPIAVAVLAVFEAKTTAKFETVWEGSYFV